MSARLMVVAGSLALILGSQPTFAEGAKERSGSSSSSRVGANHSGAAVHRAPSGTPSGSSDAQRRHPRAGTGHPYGGYDYRGHHYRPHYGSSYYFGYGWGAYGYWPYWYGYGPYWYDSPYYSGYGRPYRYRYHDEGSVRLQVEPDRARVYVDGYYAGIVDDFDGLFQRLHANVGRHEILVRLEGYKDKRFRVYVPYDHTVKIHYHMLQGSGVDTPEDLTAGTDSDDNESRAAREQERRLEQEDRERDRGREGDDDRDDRYDRPGERERVRGGSVRLEVRPDDASVYVDGEFEGTARQARRLDLAIGKHRIEVVRPGYRTVEREVDVKPGQPAEVEIELVR